MKKISIGGQAVIEGVMMKGTDTYAIAVRKPDQEIEVKVEEYHPFGGHSPILRWPFIRGVINFIESLVIGVKTLMFSASFYEDEEEMSDKEKKKAKKKAEKEANLSEEELLKKKKKDETVEGFFTVAISLVFAIALFFVFPTLVTGYLQKYIESKLLLNAIEGVIRMLIFFGYTLAISLVPDIKRLFMYHGAEHKTINCFEAGVPLTPENVMKYSRFHKRCGTSFIFMVMIISIFVFMLISTTNPILRVVFRLMLVPVIAGISYEFIKLAGRNDSLLMTILSQPGLWVQRITTREPDLDMIEVAIKSVEGVIDWREYQDELSKDA